MSLTAMAAPLMICIVPLVVLVPLIIRVILDRRKELQMNSEASTARRILLDTIEAILGDERIREFTLQNRTGTEDIRVEVRPSPLDKNYIRIRYRQGVKPGQKPDITFYVISPAWHPVQREKYVEGRLEPQNVGRATSEQLYELEKNIRQWKQLPGFPR